jgi:hypothetical protein
VGIGKIHHGQGHTDIYQEALKALNHTEGQKIIHIGRTLREHLQYGL